MRICLVTLGIVVGLVDIYFLLSVLCVLLILLRLIRTTISVFFVPCCDVLQSFYLVLSYMFELNKWKWRKVELLSSSVLFVFDESALRMTDDDNDGDDIIRTRSRCAACL